MLVMSSTNKGVGMISCVEWIILPFRRRGQPVHAHRHPTVPPEEVPVGKKKSAVKTGASSNVSSIPIEHKLVTADTKKNIVVVVQDDGEFIEGLFGACSSSKIAAHPPAGCTWVEGTAKAKSAVAVPGGDRRSEGVRPMKPRNSSSGTSERQHR